MNRKLLRATLAGLVLLVAAGAALPWLLSVVGVKVTLQQPQTSAPQPEFRSGACRVPGVGTTIVVDFGPESNKPTLVRCALGFGQSKTDTGWRLFEATGIPVAGTTQYPTGFVCRVAGYPSEASQTCDSTPTEAEGTWVYFSSDTQSAIHETWRFRMQGAEMTHPSCGSWEGWRFVTPNDGPNDRVPRVKPEPIACIY